MENNAVVKMDNALMRACYKMSVNEFRVILVALSKLPDDSKPIDQKKPYYISKEDFMKLGVAPNNVAREIRAGCGELLKREVYIDTPLGVLGAHWVQNVLHFKSDVFEELKKQYPNSQYDEEFLHELRRLNLLDSLPFIAKSDDNIVARIVFSEEIMPYISELKSKLTRLKLSDVTGFSSFYSFRIYLLMMQFKETGFVIISLDDLRKILSLEGKYEATKDLKVRVIETAVDEINKHSPYTVSYELTKKAMRGRKPTHLELKFKAKAKAIEGKSKLIERDPNTIDWVNGATDNEAKKAPSWQSKGLSDGQINKIKVNMREFIDGNSSKISPNDRRDYPEIFESWRPMLKDPSQVTAFKKVQELLERSQ